MISSGGISDLNTIGLDAYANVLLTGSTPSLLKASSNVTSVTDRGVGKTNINFLPLASVNYVVTAMIRNNDSIVLEEFAGGPRTTSFVPISTYGIGGSYRDDSFLIMIAGA